MQLERWRAVSSCINFSIFGGLVLKSTISTGQSASRTRDRVSASMPWPVRREIARVLAVLGGQGGDWRYSSGLPAADAGPPAGRRVRIFVAVLGAHGGAAPTGAARRVSIVLRRSRNTWTAIALRGERRRAERSTDGTAVPVSRLYAGAGPGQRPSRLRNSAGPPTFSPFSGSLLSGLMALTTLTTRPTDLRCAAAGARPRQRDRAPRSRRSRRPHSG